MPWHWDVEALQELSGLSAEGALEDLLDSRIKPAILDALGLSASETTIVEIERAAFTETSIVFRLSALVPRTSLFQNSEELFPSHDDGFTRFTIEGTIDTNLSIVFDLIN